MTYNVSSGTSVSQPGNTENLPELEIPPENNANLTESNWFSWKFLVRLIKPE